MAITRSISDKQQTNIRESVQSLKFIPRFFSEVRRSSPPLFYINIFLRLIVSAVPITQLWLGKLIIDEIILQVNASPQDFSQLWIYIAAELLTVVVSDLINRATGLTDGFLGDRYSIDSSVLLIKKTSEVELSQLEDSEFYDKLERARQQTTNRVGLMSNVLGQFQDLFTVISLVFGLIYFEPWLLVLLIISIIPAFINDLKFSASSYSLARSWTKERRELDYLRFIGANDKTAKEIKLFGLSDFIASRFKNLSEEYYVENRKLAVRRTMWGAFFNIIGTLSYYGAYGLIVLRTLAGLITIGDLTFLSGSFTRLKSRLESMFTRFTRISESALYLKDYFDFIDLQKLEDVRFEPRILPKKLSVGFEFEDLHFGYPGSESEVLKGITFSLKAGEKLAFVGENGAGKTTLIKLLLRFYEPTKGRILMDGVDIRHYDKAAYQEFFGVIFQDFVRYELSLKENIAVGKIEHLENEERIFTAADLSLAMDVVKDLPLGLEQQLGKRFVNGKDLSGGQWQKIALARAYMKDAEVMILDEPTSALDARAEYEAFQRFIGLTTGKTSIIISHRFSTVRMADRIVVLKDGKVLEMGDHKELIQNGQLYAELFELQAAGYQ